MSTKITSSIIDEKQRNYKRLERIWKISSIILELWFCDFCVISIILLYFIDFVLSGYGFWNEEVIYNYKRVIDGGRN